MYDCDQTNLSSAKVIEQMPQKPSTKHFVIKTPQWLPFPANRYEKRFILPNMSHSNDFAVDPSVPQDRKTRMKRRNAIVRRKRGRTDKSEDIRRQDFVSIPPNSMGTLPVKIHLGQWL
jgi:hypothetical protein